LCKGGLEGNQQNAEQDSSGHGIKKIWTAHNVRTR
jgi:hypothetical protein